MVDQGISRKLLSNCVAPEPCAAPVAAADAMARRCGLKLNLERTNVTSPPDRADFRDECRYLRDDDSKTLHLVVFPLISVYLDEGSITCAPT